MKKISKNSILFLDEIQSTPAAISALRYFYEELPELPIIAAGSLLEFALQDSKSPMPVGRIEYLHMGPMCFSEFLLALGETKLLQELETASLKKAVSSTAHNRLLQMQRTFFAVGGMPEAVADYAQNKNYKNIYEIHSNLIQTYRDDFPKYIGSRNLLRMTEVFNYCAQNVAKKIKYSNISKSEQSSTLKKDIDLLSLAKIISKVIHTNYLGIPLHGSIDIATYKLLFLDIGLMNSICGVGWDVLSKMDDIKLINEGALAEQFIGQHLLDIFSNTPHQNLLYWHREGKINNAEVDFIISLHQNIIPVEVKAGASGTMRSLHQFIAEKNSKIAVRFDTNPISIQTIKTSAIVNKTQNSVEYQLLSLPI